MGNRKARPGGGGGALVAVALLLGLTSLVGGALVALNAGSFLAACGGAVLLGFGWGTLRQFRKSEREAWRKWLNRRRV